MHLLTLVAATATLTCQTDLSHESAYRRCLRGINAIAKRAPCSETKTFALRPFYRRQINGIVSGSVTTGSIGPVEARDIPTLIAILPVLPGDLPKTDPLTKRFAHPAILLDGLGPNEVAVKAGDLRFYSDWYVGLVFQQWDAIRLNSHDARWKTVRRAGRILRLVDTRYGRLLDQERRKLPTGRSVNRIVPELVTVDSKSAVVANLRKIWQPASELELQQLTALFYMQLFFEHAGHAAPSQKDRFAWEVAATNRLKAVRWKAGK